MSVEQPTWAVRNEKREVKPLLLDPKIARVLGRFLHQKMNPSLEKIIVFTKTLAHNQDENIRLSAKEINDGIKLVKGPIKVLQKADQVSIIDDMVNPKFKFNFLQEHPVP